MNCLMMKLPELERYRIALLKRIQEENPPEDSLIRKELENVENCMKFKKKEQELKDSNSGSKHYRFLVGR
jgi:hypothetical protein